MKIAFAGFRHGHIYSLYNKAATHAGVTIVAACEEDAATAAAVPATVKLTHDSFETMLDSVACDAVAIGDYYGRRGSLALQALRRGKHVILDKPVCTNMSDLNAIEALASAKGLRVGCMLDMRCNPSFCRARKAIREGVIGKVTQIHMGGQHPLLRATRPTWYFEQGKHGGTINDIAIHGIDMITFLTGETVRRTVAAREWQAFDVQSDYFRDAAQFMLELSNGAGVIGDVSYAAPNSQGYSTPLYWRFTVWGTRGALDIISAEKRVVAYLDGEKSGVTLEDEVEAMPDCLDSFLGDIAGQAVELDTRAVIAAARATLTIQAAAQG